MISKYIDKQMVYDYLTTIPKGKLAEHYAFGGMKMQKKKLEQDGIIVENDTVDLEKYGW